MTLDSGPFTELCIEHKLHYMLRSVYLSHLWGFTYDLHNFRFLPSRNFFILKMKFLLVAFLSVRIKCQRDVLSPDYHFTCLKCENEGTDKNRKCFEMNEVDFVNTTTCKSVFGCTKQ